MPAITYLLLFISVMISGSSVFLFKATKGIYLKLLLAFSGAYLFSLCVLHLIPEIYQRNSSSIGIFILIGFFFQIVLEFFSEGIEHGHVHIHKNHSHIFPLSIMIGLCLHSFFEGMPLAQSYSEPSVFNSLLIGIILHHLPISFALMTLLLNSGLTKSKALIMLMIFAIMCPLGAVVSNTLTNNISFNANLFADRMMAIVIGIFLHISTTILFETSEEHRFNFYKFITILVGAGLALITL